MSDKEKKDIKQLRRLCDEYPEEAIQAILDSAWFLPQLDAMRLYERFDDDTREGSIAVGITPDSDAWIQVISNLDPEELTLMHRYRLPMIGGGASPRVRNALLILALAIKLDNEEFPQKR